MLIFSADLSESLIDHSEGQRFLNETVKIIVEEVLQKGTDVNEKVPVQVQFICQTTVLMPDGTHEPLVLP